MNKNTRNIALTALFIGICVVFQGLKVISVYLTGPIVNACIIITTFVCGLPYGLIIAIVTPLIAYLMGFTPVLHLLPSLLPVIMVGNVIIVLASYLFIKHIDNKRLSYIYLFSGSLFKALFMGILVVFVLIPIFGSNIPQVAQNTIKMTFSLTQLITALIGIIISLLAYSRLKYIIKD